MATHGDSWRHYTFDSWATHGDTTLSTHGDTTLSTHGDSWRLMRLMRLMGTLHFRLMGTHGDSWRLMATHGDSWRHYTFDSWGHYTLATHGDTTLWGTWGGHHTLVLGLDFPDLRFEINRHKLLAKLVLLLYFDTNHSNQTQTSSFAGIPARSRNLELAQKASLKLGLDRTCDAF